MSRHAEIPRGDLSQRSGPKGLAHLVGRSLRSIQLVLSCLLRDDQPLSLLRRFFVETPDANLSKGMRQLNGVYTRQFNRRHVLAGHPFQGRFKSILVERDTYLLEISRYVVLNPVRAGMVAAASEWPWSSYRAMVGLELGPSWLKTDWLLRQFGPDHGSSQGEFVAFVAEGLATPSVWEGLRHQVFLGSDSFVERFAEGAAPLEKRHEVPRAQRRPFANSLARFAVDYPVPGEAMARAFRIGVYTMKEIAEHFGVHNWTVSRAVRAFETNMQPD